MPSWPEWHSFLRGAAQTQRTLILGHRASTCTSKRRIFSIKPVAVVSAKGALAILSMHPVRRKKKYHNRQASTFAKMKKLAAAVRRIGGGR